MQMLAPTKARRGIVSPADLSGIALWLDAHTIPGLSDGNDLVSWVNKVGAGHSFTSPVGTTAPSWHTNVQNGLAVVRFDGLLDGLLHAAPILSGQAGSIFVVARRQNSITGRLLASCDTATSTRSISASFLNARLALQQRSNDTTDDLRGDTTLAFDTWYILEIHSDGATITMRVNGVIQALTISGGANSGDWFADTADRDNVTVGFDRRLTDSTFFQGDIGEVIVCDFASGPGLDQASRYDARRYLSDRWAITI